MPQGNVTDNRTPAGSSILPIILAVLLAAVLLGLGLAIWRTVGQSPDPTNTPVRANQESNQPTPQTSNSATDTPEPEPSESDPANSEQPVSDQPAEPTTPAAESTCPEAGACDADAQVYCPDEWSGKSVEASYKLDLVNCLYDEHKNDISTECRESLECRQALNEQLLVACEEDKRKFCATTRPKPGSEPLVDCLEDNFSQLSIDCQAAWIAHEAAKPE